VPAAPTAHAQKMDARARVDHRYRRNHSGLPCAVVYDLLRALPGEPARCHRHLRKGAGLVENMAPALARQDHTTSPSASVAFVSRNLRVHRIPRSTFVTIAKRPPGEHGTAQDGTISGFRKEKCSGRGLDVQIGLESPREFRFFRTRVRRAEAPEPARQPANPLPDRANHRSSSLPPQSPCRKVSRPCAASSSPRVFICASAR
jgi:hypothetical protein